MKKQFWRYFRIAMTWFAIFAMSIDSATAGHLLGQLGGGCQPRCGGLSSIFAKLRCQMPSCGVAYPVCGEPCQSVQSSCCSAPCAPVDCCPTECCTSSCGTANSCMPVATCQMASEPTCCGSTTVAQSQIMSDCGCGGTVVSSGYASGGEIIYEGDMAYGSNVIYDSTPVEGCTDCQIESGTISEGTVTSDPIFKENAGETVSEPVADDIMDSPEDSTPEVAPESDPPEDLGDMFEEAPADPADDLNANPAPADDLMDAAPAEVPANDLPANDLPADDFPMDELPTENVPGDDLPSDPPADDDSSDDLEDLFGAHQSAPQRNIMRTWSDNTGKFSTVAEIESIRADSVRLRKENGRFCTVPLRRLSDADFDYVQAIAKQQGKAPLVRVAAR